MSGIQEVLISQSYVTAKSPVFILLLCMKRKRKKIFPPLILHLISYFVASVVLITYKQHQNNKTRPKDNGDTQPLPDNNNNHFTNHISFILYQLSVFYVKKIKHLLSYLEKHASGFWGIQSYTQ